MADPGWYDSPTPDSSAPASNAGWYDAPIADVKAAPADDNSKSSGSALEDILGDVKSIPASIFNLAKAIPSAVEAYPAALRNSDNILDDAYNLAKSTIFGTPMDAPKGDYPAAVNTLSGIGNLATTVATGGALGPLVGAGPTIFNKVQQAVGEAPTTTGEQDLNSLRRNLVQGGLLTGVGDAVSAAAGAVSDAIAPEPVPTTEEQAISNLGLNKADYSKAAKNKGNSAMQDALQGAQDRGVFSGYDVSPTATQVRNEAAITDLANKIHGSDGVLSQADSALQEVQDKFRLYQGGIDPLSGEPLPEDPNAPTSMPSFNLPSFKNAKDFIAQHPNQAPQLSAQLGNQINTILNGYSDEHVAIPGWDGSLSGLSKAKSVVGNDAFGVGSGQSKGLNSAIYQDLKTSIQDQADQIVPGLGKKVGDLNSDLSEHYTLRPSIQDAVNGQNSTATRIVPPVPVPSIFKAALSGGWKGAAASGPGFLIPGGHLIPLAGALTGAAIEGGNAALQNPAIASGLASTLKGASSIFGNSLLPAAVVALGNDRASQVNQTNQTKELSQQMPVSFSNNTTPGTLNYQRYANSTVSPALRSIFNNLPPKKVMSPETDAAAIAMINANPYLKASSLMEDASMDPNLKNPKSTATGLFQFTDQTAHDLKINPHDITQSLKGKLDLDASNAKVIGTTNPQMLYAAHYLGATALKKVIDGKQSELTDDEKANLNTLETKLLPKFTAYYNAELAKQSANG